MYLTGIVSVHSHFGTHRESTLFFVRLHSKVRKGRGVMRSDASISKQI